MQQIADETFDFAGPHRFASQCRLRVYEGPGLPLVVIATERPDNPGTSVTNAAEVLATQVYQWLEYPARGMVFIEHYEQDGQEDYAQERFALVSFAEMDGQFISPQWQHMTKEEVEGMIGQPL
jgi:hypothetical protein